jgi:hypothetical protein
MRRNGVAAMVAVAAVLAACEDTEECRRLRALKASHERVLITMQARAGLKDKAVARAKAAEADAQALLDKLGLEKSDDELSALLAERAAAVKADLQKGTRDVPLDDPQAKSETQVVWSFALSAKDAAAAVDQTFTLAKGPPLFRFVALLSDGTSWRLQLAKATVARVPIQVAPMPAPERKSAADIPSELGFCGASGLRGEVAALDAKIDALQAEAEATTVAMPTTASYEGLKSRAMLADLEENESRRIVAVLSSAALRANLKIKALGVEGAVVILELFGGPKERVKFTEQLDAKTLEELKPAPTEHPGLVRYMMVNRVGEQARSRGKAH